MTTLTQSSAASVFLQEAEMFAELYGKQQDGLAALREEARQHFARMGFPTTRHEEWKYVNLSDIAATAFRTPGPSDAFSLNKSNLNTSPIAGEGSILIVIENGRFNAGASSSVTQPEGIRIGQYKDFADDKNVLSHLFRHADSSKEALVALNTMLCCDPVILHVARGKKIETPVNLLYAGVGSTEPVAVFPRVLVVLEEQAELTLTESFHTIGNAQPVFTNAVCEVVIGPAARLHQVKVQKEASNASHINFHQVHMSRDSYQHITTVTLGGALVRNNLHIRLDAAHVNSYLNGLYVLNANQVVDNHTLVDHAMPNCYSNELYKGIIDGSAQGVFNGKIWVRQDAQKTNAYQSNKNLLLSDTAGMNTKPQLEIYADDVKCSHGATTGQLDDEALFYLRARGIGESTARALLNHAFAADVIEQVDNEEIRQNLLKLLDEKLA